nr:LCP family protein [Bacilli bacterium]
YGSINSVSRSDVNIILSVNPEKGKIIITSIPRDYYVKLHKNGEYDKLTHAGIYGVEESVSTIEDLLGIDINYYVKVNFTSLVKFVDTIDGIDVDSKYAFKSDDGYSYNVGKNHLNGKKALSFARERHALPKGDKSRGENHQAILTGIINKVSNKSILVKYNDLLKSLKPSIVTNFTNSEITSFVKNQIKKDTKWQIEYVNLDGTDGYEYTYSYQRNKLYVMIPDESTIETAKEKINELMKKGSK